MSFGQGGPQWGPGGQNQDPYGGQRPYGSRNAYNSGTDSFDAFGTRRTDDANTPDWAALADASAARTRRKRLFLVGGGARPTRGKSRAGAGALV